jgi:hypothetical protein
MRHISLCEAANIGTSTEYGENIMRVLSILRNATLALSLMVTLGTMSTAFVGSAAAATAPQASTASPYDGSNFVIPESQIFS